MSQKYIYMFGTVPYDATTATRDGKWSGKKKLGRRADEPFFLTFSFPWKKEKNSAPNNDTKHDNTRPPRTHTAVSCGKLASPRGITASGVRRETAKDAA